MEKTRSTNAFLVSEFRSPLVEVSRVKGVYHKYRGEREGNGGEEMEEREARTRDFSFGRAVPPARGTPWSRSENCITHLIDRSRNSGPRSFVGDAVIEFGTKASEGPRNEFEEEKGGGWANGKGHEWVIEYEKSLKNFEGETPVANGCWIFLPSNFYFSKLFLKKYEEIIVRWNYWYISSSFRYFREKIIFCAFVELIFYTRDWYELGVTRSEVNNKKLKQHLPRFGIYDWRYFLIIKYFFDL